MCGSQSSPATPATTPAPGAYRLSDMTDDPKPQAAQDATYDLDSPQRRREVLAEAVDYRGDVTLKLADGREVVGYVFDRRDDAVRVMLPEGGRESLAPDTITRVAFTGRDTAAGKSWETWVKKYARKKMAGEAANIDPEPLEDEK